MRRGWKKSNARSPNGKHRILVSLLRWICARRRRPQYRVSQKRSLTEAPCLTGSQISQSLPLQQRGPTPAADVSGKASSASTNAACSHRICNITSAQYAALPGSRTRLAPGFKVLAKAEKQRSERPCIKTVPEDHVHPCARHMANYHMSAALQSAADNFFFSHTAPALRCSACPCKLRPLFDTGSTAFGPSGLTVLSGGKTPMPALMPTPTWRDRSTPHRPALWSSEKNLAVTGN